MEKYMKCFVPSCGNDSKNSSKTLVRIREDFRKRWCRDVNVEYFQCYTQYCCEDHFDPEQDLVNRYFKYANQEPKFKLTAKLRNIVVHLQEEMHHDESETSELARLLLQSEPVSKRRCVEMNTPISGGITSSPLKVNDQDSHPGPSTASLSTTGLQSNALSKDGRDPLRKVLEQCRFCGEFSKECIPAINQPYITDSRTSLAFNDVTVHLDFNDASLPTTVCRDCDARLQEMFDFVKVVKTAQSTLINVAEQREEIETLVIKTECDEDDESHDHEGNNDDDDNKDGIVDSVTVGETVYIKESFSHKRKTVHDKTETANSKKPKTKEKEKGACEIMIEIKEEVIEDDTNGVNSANSDTGYLAQLGLGGETGRERQFVETGQSGLSDTGTDDKPSEVELATSSLVYEMANDGTGGFSQ